MSSIEPSSIIALLKNHSYFLMFAIMTVEGNVITYLAAFVASLGFLNIYLVLSLSILGNVLGDIILYSIGRFGKTSKIKAYFRRKMLEKSFISKIEKNLK